MSTQSKNNYELADAILQLFGNDPSLPNRKFNACLSCSNATWYRSSTNTLSATCSKMNVVVYRREIMSDQVGSIQVCSGNPNFQPEPLPTRNGG